MILRDLRLIFFHVGKTGGTTIERMIACKSEGCDFILNKKKGLYNPVNTITPYDEKLRHKYGFGFNKKHGVYLQHMTIQYFLEHYKDLSDYYTFSFVRNPYERILSAYFYNGHDRSFKFSDFVNKKLPDLYGHISKYGNVSHFGSQLNFTHVKSNDGTYIKYVDFIGKLESLKYDLNILSHKRNLNLNLNDIKVLHKTKSSQVFPNYIDAYNRETLDVINKLYKQEFLIYNYHML